MNVRVVLPSQLQGYTDGLREVPAEGATPGEVLADLDRRFPGLRFRVIDEQDRVRRHILLFVDRERTEDLDRPLVEGTVITLVGALSGG
ncbi:MAG: MoaD/ThiS family protein [Alphaproteobacteria bacterium]|nr:MoaD/ThiS family protein [Alphaproteobacteria bacterium]MCB9696405.1 MoaD/ThiS family protein [Alphaproteobacteria bacterium]